MSYNANEPIREMTVAKAKFERLDCPACYFAGWAYDIDPAHYGALGVLWRSDSYGRKYQALAGSIEYGFAVGDLFFLRRSRAFLQVVAIEENDIEVHVGAVGVASSRIAFKTTPGGLASWLLLGWPPSGAALVPKGLSRAGLLSWSLPA